MAKQGNMKLIGRRGNVIFYQLREGFYLRTKSTLDGKRVKTDPAFKKTMANASVFGVASKISTEVYHQLPKEKKKNRIDLAITSHAMALLNVTGLTPEETKAALIKEYL